MATTCWIGEPPTHCQLCNTKIEDDFVDGRVGGCGWSIMCSFCALAHGIGLGIGKGQLYTRINNGFVKVQG